MTTHRPPNCGPAWFRGANRLLDGAAGLFQTAAELLLTVMLVINFANIVLRNIGQPSLLWVSPWTLVLMVWAVFLGFFVMYRRHLDIVLGLVIDRLGPFGRRMARVLTALAGLAFTLILLAETPQILARQRGTMELIGLTRYWLSLPLLASAAMLTLHFLTDLIGVLAGWADDDAPGSEEAAQW
ncbi:MAG: TRAP transporter small permease subunit [Rhodobacteraceae bacterium]|uniref:TRAP transporter small permease n=1 Tax=Salipiger sp. HF18 TaxID=2721557 RepID=UPI000C39EE02|nr:TRAP transporter small permease [Salipiger sp. HF18]MAU48338.1 hypothetical protein [Salipiger sp.]NIY94818.1 TRAP transporter small permease [Salipiger sp. HF18]NVK61276.1 TRAP transporter small permease subunit [Paracoccaceae bacterium]